MRMQCLGLMTPPEDRPGTALTRELTRSPGHVAPGARGQAEHKNYGSIVWINASKAYSIHLCDMARCSKCINAPTFGRPTIAMASGLSLSSSSSAPRGGGRLATSLSNISPVPVPLMADTGSGSRPSSQNSAACNTRAAGNAASTAAAENGPERVETRRPYGRTCLQNMHSCMHACMCVCVCVNDCRRILTYAAAS
jgi:hypothetical protein